MKNMKKEKKLLFECIGGNTFKLVNPQPISMIKEEEEEEEHKMTSYDMINYVDRLKSLNFLDIFDPEIVQRINKDPKFSRQFYENLMKYFKGGTYKKDNYSWKAVITFQFPPNILIDNGKNLKLIKNILTSGINIGSNMAHANTNAVVEDIGNLIQVKIEDSGSKINRTQNS